MIFFECNKKYKHEMLHWSRILLLLPDTKINIPFIFLNFNFFCTSFGLLLIYLVTFQFQVLHSHKFFVSNLHCFASGNKNESVNPATRLPNWSGYYGDTLLHVTFTNDANSARNIFAKILNCMGEMGLLDCWLDLVFQ